MKRKMVFFLLWISAYVISAYGGETVYYEDDFEKGDAAFQVLGDTPEGLNSLAQCRPRVLADGVFDECAFSGKHSLKLDVLFRAAGSMAPIIYFKEPVKVTEPVYFSGYLKVGEEKTGADHMLRFLLWAEFPEDPKPVLGKLSTRSMKNVRKGTGGEPEVWKGDNLLVEKYEEQQDGWVYYYSDDLKEKLEQNAKKRGLDPRGMCIFGWSLYVTRANPGERYCVYVDDVKLSNQDPVPAPSARRVKDAMLKYQNMAGEMQKIGAKIQDDKMKAELKKVGDELKPLSTQLNAGGEDQTSATRFCSLMERYERMYWKIKWKLLSSGADRL